jgi:hypothetical protein
MVEMSEIFWSSFITIISGLILALIAICYKSKCTEIKCGCIKIKRDVITEEREREFEITHPSNNPIGQV